jgi:hypothetical protein
VGNVFHAVISGDPMTQRIILIHGRNTKPAREPYEALQLKALIAGVARCDTGKADKLSDGSVKIDVAYYGHVNNRLLAKKTKIRAKMTEHDHAFGGAPCIPHAGVDQAIDAMLDITKFNARAYSKILRNNKDFRWRDDFAAALSGIAAFFSNALLNEFVISSATADMGAYLLTRKVGSEIRTILQEPLKAALLAGDDICLISHSLGCIVAYDVLWKFSRMSEYKAVQVSGSSVKLWLTLGCPLGEAGVEHNLYDFHERGEDRYPLNIIDDWLNIAAKDDFVAHDSTMKNSYRKMKKQKMLNSITDQEIYNCYAIGGVANPHKLYGYLVDDKTGQAVADWIN